MSIRLPVFLVAALFLLASCSYPIRNEPLLDNAHPEYVWRTLPAQAPQDTLVIVTASGGGTRATALSMAVLSTLDRVRLASGVSMADKIDVLSSVSGGSVTAAYFALHGAAGLPMLERDFVRQDGMTALIAGALNPVGLARLATPSRERIDLLIDYLDNRLFGSVTFEALIKRRHRPYLILNAADMVEGTPFPLTQYTMDLLCSDLSKMKLSTAVAASAAFPVALSPVTLKNYRPCAVRPPPGWLGPAGRTSWYLDPTRVAWQRTAAAYADGSKEYVHLLDGGIADNIGVSEPYRLLTGDDVDPRFKLDIAQGRIKKIVFVMVNARSFMPSDLDRQQATPGMLDMLTASINSSIDRATFNTAERLRTLLADKFRGIADDAARAGQPGIAASFRTVAANTQLIAVDFDAIDDRECRRRFHSIPTNWALSNAQIDALTAVGEALVTGHPDFPAALTAVQGSLTVQPKTLAEACALAARTE
jgi:NTE family protein